MNLDWLEVDPTDIEIRHVAPATVGSMLPLEFAAANPTTDASAYEASDLTGFGVVLEP